MWLFLCLSYLVFGAESFKFASHLPKSLTVMSAKKLLNDPADCVAEAVEGLLLSHPDLKRVEGTNVIVRGDIESFKNDHVTIISGGGSGHEPAHAGYGNM
jgi:hypothetical protein